MKTQIPARLQFSPDVEWRARFEKCVRKYSLGNTPGQIMLARRSLLQNIFQDGVERIEKFYGIGKHKEKGLPDQSKGAVQEETQSPVEVTDERSDEDELDELLQNFDPGWVADERFDDDTS